MDVYLLSGVLSFLFCFCVCFAGYFLHWYYCTSWSNQSVWKLYSIWYTTWIRWLSGFTLNRERETMMKHFQKNVFYHVFVILCNCNVKISDNQSGRIRYVVNPLIVVSPTKLDSFQQSHIAVITISTGPLFTKRSASSQDIAKISNVDMTVWASAACLSRCLSNFEAIGQL